MTNFAGVILRRGEQKTDTRIRSVQLIHELRTFFGDAHIYYRELDRLGMMRHDIENIMPRMGCQHLETSLFQS